MNKLQDVYEQMIKMNNEVMDNWLKMMNKAPWMSGPQAYMGSNWNNLLEQNLELFLTATKETRNYRQAVEKQLQENWEQLKKAQIAQQELTRKFFENMANFLKEEAESPKS